MTYDPRRDPPIQNISLHTDLGRQVRDALLPKGPVMPEFDYASLEYRLLAQMNRAQTCAASGVPPTHAILWAEQADERWCCPACGGLNACGGPVDGWCQHALCVDRRSELAVIGVYQMSEILWPLVGFKGPAEDA